MIIITQEDQYPLRPCDINTEGHFYGPFESTQAEISARWIVKLCQWQGAWTPFTRGVMEAFYNKKGYQDFWFNGLDRELVPLLDGRYYVTHEFITKCFEASPKIIKKLQKT